MLRIITLLLFFVINIFCIEAIDIAEKMSSFQSITVLTYKQPYVAESPIIEAKLQLSLDDILALNSPVLNSAIEWMPLEDQESIPLYEVDAATLQVLLGDKEVEITAYKLANAKNFLQIPLKQQDYDSFSLEEWWQTCQNFRQQDIAPDGEVSYYYDAPGLDIAKNIFIWRKRREIFPAYAFFDTEKYVELLGVTDEFVIFRNQESLISFNYESSSVGCRESIDKDFKVCISGDNSTLLYIKNQTHHIDDVPDPLWLLSLKKNGELERKKIVDSFFNLLHFALSYDGKAYAYITDDYIGRNLYAGIFNSNGKKTLVKLDYVDPEIRNIVYGKDNSFIVNCIHKRSNSSDLYAIHGDPSCSCKKIFLPCRIQNILFTTVWNNLHASIIKIENNRCELLILDTTDEDFFRLAFQEQPILAPQISSDGCTITILTSTRTLRYTKDNETNTWQLDDSSYSNHELAAYVPLTPHQFDIQPIPDYRQIIISPDGLTLATKNNEGTITIWDKVPLYEILQSEQTFRQ